MRKVAQLADIDYLTQVSSRLHFLDTLRERIRLAESHQQQFALLLIDIDHFKMINHTLGYSLGDVLLKAVATRIKSCIRKEDFIARLGNDQFVVMIGHVKDREDAGKVAAKLISAFHKSLLLADKEIWINLSIGIDCYPGVAISAEGLLKNVDMALAQVKLTGRKHYQYYHEVLGKAQERILQIKSALQSAIQQHEFSLVYQPIVDLAEGNIIYFEALLRWRHPVLGEVSPEEFITMAESSGMIMHITTWVIEHVTRQLLSWKEMGKQLLPIAINFSAMDIWQHNMLKKFITHIKKHQLSLDVFQIEITETAIMQHEELVLKDLEDLKNMGIRIAIDDFGIGYSSLGRLHKLPIYALKIDSSFILPLPQDQQAMNIVEMIIGLSEKMHFKVVAEGVETKEQAEFLKKRGCDYAQGFYFYKPMPAEDVVNFLSMDNKEDHVR